MDNTHRSLNILLIGANGGIGRQSVIAALKAGHKVTAVVRNPANLTLTHTNLQVVKGDVCRPDTYIHYLEHTDVIISAIGIAKDKPTTLYSSGNAHLLAAMKSKGVNRAFFISASAIEISPVQPLVIRLLTKYVVQKLFGHSYADQRIMEKLIKQSDINWTIVRPPRLTDKPGTGGYRMAINTFLKNCFSISRADVAHFMINNLFNKAIYKTTVEIGY